MKTKKTEEFVKRARTLSGTTKFAAVVKGSNWQLFEGSHLAEAAPKDGETLIKATCRVKQKVLNVLVVGSMTETNIFKQKIFAAPLKAEPDSVTFKAVSAQDDAELEQMLGELEGTLVEQIAKLMNPLLDSLTNLRNQAYDLVTAGDAAGARAKFQELKTKLASAANPTPTGATGTGGQPSDTAKPKDGVGPKQGQDQALADAKARIPPLQVMITKGLLNVGPTFAEELKRIQASLQQADNLTDAGQVNTACDGAKQQIGDVVTRAKAALDVAQESVKKLLGTIAKGLDQTGPAFVGPALANEVQGIQTTLQQASALIDPAQITAQVQAAKVQFADVVTRAKKARDAALERASQLLATIAKGLDQGSPAFVGAPFVDQVKGIQLSLQGLETLTDPAQITSRCDTAMAQFKDVVTRAKARADELKDLHDKVQDVLGKLGVFLTAALPEFADSINKLIIHGQTLVTAAAAPDADAGKIKAAYEALRKKLVELLQEDAKKKATAKPLSPEEVKKAQIKTLNKEARDLGQDINNPTSQKKLVEAVKKLAQTDPTGPEAQMMEALQWDFAADELQKMRNHTNGPLDPKKTTFEDRLVEVYKTLNSVGSDLSGKLTPGELVAIRSYTDDVPPVPAQYSQMNGKLIGYMPPRDDKRKAQIEKMVDEAKKALAKLDDHQTWPTMRGEQSWTGDDAQYVKDNEFTIKSFWSTGQSFSGKWQITVFGKKGKKIADASKFGASEQEVLFPPDTKFKVLAVGDKTASNVSVTVQEV